MQTGEITQQQKIIIGILAVIGLIMFYSKVYAPLGEKITKASEVLENKEKKLAKMQKKAKQLDKMEKEFKILEEKLKQTEKILPKKQEIPEFIKVITDIAKKYNMDVDNFNISPSAGGEYYDTYQYTMRLQSSYHKFGLFFAEIVQLERIFSIKDVVFNAMASAGDLEETIVGSFSVQSYTAKEK